MRKKNKTRDDYGTMSFESAGKKEPLFGMWRYPQTGFMFAPEAAQLDVKRQVGAN